MDLYTLYALWYEQGGGKTAYAGGGFEQGAPVNELRRKRIADMFEVSLLSQAKLLINIMIKAIPDEVSSIFDEHLIPWSHVQRDLDGTALYDRLEKLRSIAVPKSLYDPPNDVAFQKAIWREFTVMEIHKLFALPLWKEESCDQYGGAAWARIVETFGRLVEAYKAQVPKNLMYWVDRVYDLAHNNGSIMTKAPKKWRVSKADLDYRANAKLADFKKVCSPIVQNMIPSSYNESTIVSSLIGEEDIAIADLVEHFLNCQEKLNPSLYQNQSNQSN